ncbi:VanZ like family protein [Mariniphaga anaerophila]|uniref:VanZ like family protein n=1 Tax=Mariniphaga anaerophila TaxID=1484053 RepID=A0A1M5EKJ9_9BACT|nr:VanZ family protein [Mariniphaga anaerophila]SHF79601.1 VanZ like family protein [Mariniphaga anaerophila]
MILRIFIKPLIWLAIICYGLFVPANDLPKKPFLSIPHFDKLVHFGLFFMFCLLLFVPFKKLKTKYLFYAPAISLLFAAILEGTQHMISASRSSNLYDFIANSAGIFAAAFFFYFFVSGRKWEKYF